MLLPDGNKIQITDVIVGADNNISIHFKFYNYNDFAVEDNYLFISNEGKDWFVRFAYDYNKINRNMMFAIMELVDCSKTPAFKALYIDRHLSKI